MLFACETDFAEDLHCLPMIVRWKLDRCQHWLKFSLSQRQWLVTNYAQQLQAWVRELTGMSPALLPIPKRFAWQAKFKTR
jgi:Conserved nitrate reductase-associated protein (Nitr_red_assoc).